MMGAKAKAVKMAEDRLLFKQAMADIGLATPRSGVVGDIREAMRVIQDIGFPAVIRPSFTLGGTGGGIAFNSEEFESIIQRGLDLSPVDRKSTRLNSSHSQISYAVFCLKKKKNGHLPQSQPVPDRRSAIRPTHYVSV